jgi:hypothetical protein
MNYKPDNDPLEWSHRAEEARAMADGMNDPGARKTLIGIAETYEAMLKRAEEKILAK